MERISLYNRLKQIIATHLYRNALYLMLDMVIKSGLGFIFWIIAARFYTAADVGFSSAIFSVVGLLASLSLLGLDISIVRFLPRIKKTANLINTSFTLGGTVNLAVAVVFLAGLKLWAPRLTFIADSAMFISVFLLFSLTLISIQLMDHVFIAKRKAEFTLATNSVVSLLKIPLLIFFAMFWHSFGIIASLALASGIAISVAIFIFLPRAKIAYRPIPAVDTTMIKRMWGYSSSNYLANLFSAAPFFLLPLMVLNLLGPTENAYYYVARMMVNSLFIISLAVSYSLFAEGSHSEEKLRENVVRAFKFTILLLVPALVLFIFAGKWLLFLFGYSYYVNALPLLQILAISALPQTVIHIYCTILRVNHRIRELIIIWALASGILLGSSYFAVPLLGIVGIGYTHLGTHCLLAIYVFVRKNSMWRKPAAEPASLDFLEDIKTS
ncbi:lipopolysaccharide biosynthesis protein [Chloroflexota bacterium]